MLAEFFVSVFDKFGMPETLASDFEWMGFDFRFVIYALVFLGVLIAFDGIRQLFFPGEHGHEARNRRMRMLSSGKTEEQVLEVFKPKTKKGLLSRLPIVGDLPAAMRAAGMTMSPAIFALICSLGFVVFAGIASTIIHPLGGFGLAALCFLILPLLIVENARRKRTDKMIRQLPDALDLMARGLKVGHPMNATLRSVADEMPDPIGTEFGVVVDQVAYGDELGEAMRDLATRIPEEDIQYLAIAIGIQHGTGGDLGRILTTLSTVIRNRFTMRRKIRAISSEGRLSAIFLSSLPLFIGVFTSITAPSYYGDVLDAPLFMPIAICVAVLVILNAIAMRKLVNFRF